ncbi:uncharacterized protein LOC133738016 [Rosa rugosa]|uniref:uncharacterized protein LOC133738016 n=1 Tax=Rosa rugosa TaxID=74645 RepID=UPI002B40B664|nr:uncharacterized protein LOC133738016 [Rosa rugosa]
MKARHGAMAVKLDLEKAYDFLDWNYICCVLSKFGFSSKWIDLIMECVSSVSFSILINGKAKGHFKPSRGLRQGDPISPYIFILCTEPLIRSLNAASTTSKHHVGLLSSPNGVRVSNLLFADDCLIFGRGSPKAARNITRILSRFAACSGQHINSDKSSVYFSSNLNASTKLHIANILGIQHRTTIGKYLGVHNIIFWKDPLNAKELLVRISKKLSGWKSSTLSRAGRLTLLKSSASVVPIHVLSCFKCPHFVLKSIEKEMRNFFWGSSGSPPVAWEQVCLPKSKGGLGIRPLVDATSRASIDLDESVSDYLVNGVWNIEKLSQYLESSIVRDISFVNLPFSDKEDEFVWRSTSDGKFSIKSATWSQCNQNVHPKANLLNKIWKLNIPPKAKHFAWLLVRDRLKTRARLSRFNSRLLVSILFVACNAPMDALENCLLLCWQIWKKRNDVLFRDSGFSPASVVHASASFCAAYRTHNPRSATTSNSLSEVIKWHPPPENFVKLNFDGSISSSNQAATGFVIRNHFGDPIVAGSRSIGSSTVPLAECIALKDGLLAAKRFNLDHI